MRASMNSRFSRRAVFTVRVDMITGSLVIIENLFPPNYRYRYRLEMFVN